MTDRFSINTRNGYVPNICARMGIWRTWPGEPIASPLEKFTDGRFVAFGTRSDLVMAIANDGAGGLPTICAPSTPLVQNL